MVIYFFINDYLQSSCEYIGGNICKPGEWLDLNFLSFQMEDTSHDSSLAPQESKLNNIRRRQIIQTL
jgi:hypothetical protein